MRRTFQIAAIALLVLLAALAAATVQTYRRGRAQYNRDLTRTLRDLDDIKVRATLSNASDALRNLQIYATDYVLTGRADSLNACHESVEDWQYESGTLELLSLDESRASLIRGFSKTGGQLAGEMTTIVSLYGTGAHDAALIRLRTGAAMAYRDKISGLTESAEKAFSRVGPGRTYDSPGVSHRMLYYAGGLFLVGFAGLAMLLCLLRTTPAATDSVRYARRESAHAAPGNPV